MPNRPPAKLTQADLRKLKKVATGPLLGASAGNPASIPPRPGSARVASLGNFAALKVRLNAILEAHEQG